MTDQAAKAVEEPDHKPDVPPWLRATMADVKTVDFEAPIAGSVTADCDELADRFRSLFQPQEEGVELTDDPTARVFNLLSSVLGMHFKPEQKNEPFGPMVTFADGRRSAIPEDFRKAHVDVLAYMADRAMNPVLRARLCDISWLLDRKRGVLGTRAISSYVEIVRKSDAGELKWRFPEENEDGDSNTKRLLICGEPCRSVEASDGTRPRQLQLVCWSRSFASARTVLALRFPSIGFRALTWISESLTPPRSRQESMTFSRLSKGTRTCMPLPIFGDLLLAAIT